MAVTHINYYFAIGASGDNCSCVGLTPGPQPGELLFVGSAAIKDSIGSQVAYRMAGEQFVTLALDHLQKFQPAEGVGVEDPGEQLLSESFKGANSAVYQFGHKLAAGGRLAASMVAMYVGRDQISAGRVGDGGIYIYRGGKLAALFAPQIERDPHGGGFMGSDSLVSVELASMAIKGDDALIISSKILDEEQEEVLEELLKIGRFADPVLCKVIGELLFGPEQSFHYLVFCRFGPEAIYLERQYRSAL